MDASSIGEGRSERQIGVAGSSWEHRHHRAHPSTTILLAAPQWWCCHKWRRSSSSRNSQCGHSQLPAPSFLKEESPILLSFFFFFPSSSQFSSATLEEIWQNPTSKMQFPHNTHTHTHTHSLSLCNQNFCNKKCTSPKQKQRNLSLQQPPKKNKISENGFRSFIFSWSSRSLCNFLTHQALDDDQRPKAKNQL